MNKVERALNYIVNILNKNKVRFQIVGGLACVAYGVKRKVIDIDIIIHEKDFKKIVPDVQKYIVEGPQRSKSDTWDCYYLELNYRGMIIEFGGAGTSKIFDKKDNLWINFEINLERPIMRNILGIKIPVIQKKQLIKYKKILGREVDKIDINYLNRK